MDKFILTGDRQPVASAIAMLREALSSKVSYSQAASKKLCWIRRLLAWAVTSGFLVCGSDCGAFRSSGRQHLQTEIGRLSAGSGGKQTVRGACTAPPSDVSGKF
jgi:hypothetical protein